MLSDTWKPRLETPILLPMQKKAPGLGASVIADQPTFLSEIETEVQLWELPHLLAESSLYHREPKKCVIVEGWLYKKTSTRISTTWVKSWFVLDDTGVYYMKLIDDNNASPGIKFMPKRDIMGAVFALK